MGEDASSAPTCKEKFQELPRKGIRKQLRDGALQLWSMPVMSPTAFQVEGIREHRT